MIELSDPDVYEVLQGIDLLDPDAEFIKFNEHNFTAGMGAFIKEKTMDESGLIVTVENRAFDY